MKQLILILNMFLLLGCVTQKEEKRRNQANEYFALNKAELANLCKKEFPYLITEYVPGKPIVKKEIEYLPGETIECPEPSENNPKPSVDCPPNKHTKETVTIHDTVKIADTKDLFLKETENQILKEVIEKQSALFKEIADLARKYENEKFIENKAKIKYMWISGCLLGLILIYAAFKIYKKFFLK